jgi:hypothetical protein
MRWWSAGDPVGVATVVGTLRSAPRPPGAAMVIGPDGTVAGSVSGGCVEGAVYDLAQQVVASGAPVNSFASRPRMLVFGAIDFAAAARREACPVWEGLNGVLLHTLRAEHRLHTGGQVTTGEDWTCRSDDGDHDYQVASRSGAGVGHGHQRALPIGARTVRVGLWPTAHSGEHPRCPCDRWNVAQQGRLGSLAPRPCLPRAAHETGGTRGGTERNCVVRGRRRRP